MIYNALSVKSTVKLSFKVNGKSTKSACTFPSNSSMVSLRFVSIVRILNILLKNHRKGVIATRRDIYYQDVKLFKSQTTVDNIINLLVKSLGFTPMELGAVAAQKGIFFGSLEFINEEDQVVASLNKVPFTACLIPRFSSIARIRSVKKISSILVIEKEAVFTTLLQSKEYGSLSSDHILITGKGYPDLLTKDFLKLLMACYPEVPVIAMVDLDPFGMSILKNYRDHNNEKSILKRIKLSKLSLIEFFEKDGSLCLELNIRDFSMARTLVNAFSANFDPEDEKDLHFLEECQRMMFFHKKAELDLITSIEDRLRSIIEDENFSPSI